jgi:ribonuclease E
VTEDFVDDFAGPAGVDTDPEPVAVEADRAGLPVFEEPRRREAEQSAPPAETPTVAEAAPRRRGADPVASEPKIERVVVTPDQAAATADAAAEQPARKGWWQRRLGG